MNAFLSSPAVIDYGAAKAALANFSRVLSKESGLAGSASTPLAPPLFPPSCGWVIAVLRQTVGTSQGVDQVSVVRQQEQQAATRCFSTPAEVADLVVLRASERAGNTTGSDFVIDGVWVSAL